MDDDDLPQAIQAAYRAIHDHALHQVIDGVATCYCQRAAELAVNAAAPILLQATRDRHAALEVQAAKLRDLLEQMATEHLFDQEASIDWDWLHEMKRKVLAVLQISGPDRGHTILQEVQRLREANDGLYRQAMAKELRALQEFRRTVFAALPVIWPKDDPHADTFRKIAEAHNALDPAAQREADGG